MYMLFIPFLYSNKYEKLKHKEENGQIEKYMHEYIGKAEEINPIHSGYLEPNSHLKPSNLVQFPSIQRSTHSVSILSEKPQEIWEMMNQNPKAKRGIDKITHKKLILEYVIQKRNKERNDVKKYLDNKSSVLTSNE